MTRKGCWFRQWIPSRIIKPSLSRSEYEGGNNSSRSADCMNNSTSRKVNHSCSPQWRWIIRRKKSIVTPRGVCDHWIDKARETDAITEIGCHLTSFRQSSRDNSGSRGGKGELKDPKAIRRYIVHEKVLCSDEGVSLNRVLSPKGKSVSH